MTKEEFDKYEQYICELVEKSNHTRQDLIDDLISRKVPEDIAQQIVNKHVDAKNNQTLLLKPRFYFLGTALIIGAIPILALIIWITYKNGLHLSKIAASIPVFMVIFGSMLIHSAVHQKIIK